MFERDGMPGNGREEGLWSGSRTAHYLGITENRLAKLRMRGVGSTFLKIGGQVRYDPDDVASWLRAQRRISTTQEAGS